MNTAAPSPSDSSIAQAYQEARDGKFVHTNIVGLFALIDKRAREIDASAPAAAVGGDRTLETSRRRAAVETLHNLGYTWSGGQLWKPPIGPRPRFLDDTPAAPVGGFVVVSDMQEFVHPDYGTGLFCTMDAVRAASPAAQPSAKDGVGSDIWEAYKTWPEDIRAKLSCHDLRRMGGWAQTPNPDDWGIDTSAGGPILVYQNCSVIQDEQARYVLNLIAKGSAKDGMRVCQRCGTPDYETESGIVESCACASNITTGAGVAGEKG